MFKYLRAGIAKFFRFNIDDPISFKYFINGNRSKSGVSVTEEKSLGLSIVYACVNNIASTLAGLPFNVMENQADGSKQVATSHDQYFLLKSRPHQFYTKYMFLKTLLAYALLWGNGYARIIRNGQGRPVGYELRHPKYMVTKLIEVSPGVVEKWHKDTRLGGEMIPDKDMVHIMALSLDGIEGISPIQAFREGIGLGLANQQYAANFYGKGTNVGGVIKLPGRLDSQEQIERLRESFRDKYAGMNNTHEVMVLEEGADFQSLGMPPADADVVNGAHFNIEQAARIYNMPPPFVGHLIKSSFNNIQELKITLVEGAYMPWVVAVEQEFNYKAFREAERGRFFTRIELKGLLRGDIKSRTELYRVLLDRGVFTINDVLQLEDMNKTPDGDRRMVPINMVPLDRIDDYLESILNNNGNNNNTITNGQGIKDLLPAAIAGNGHG